jgi:hypothetical protein
MSTGSLPNKYNRSAMENACRLQCKALRGREKSRPRKNNGKAMRRTMETIKIGPGYFRP